jgi:hypothetical protein
MKRDVQLVRAVDAPYARVRDRLRDDAPGVFGSAGEPITTSLVASIRGTEVSRDVSVEIVAFDEPASAAVGAHLVFRADASRHPDLFPHLEARIDAVPVTEERTAVFLIATYKPPLGVVGGAVNTLGLHRFAEQSLARLLDEIAERVAG